MNEIPPDTSIEALLRELGASGIRLRRDGEQLVVQAPNGALTPALKRELAEHKARLLALLRSEAATPALADDRARRAEPFPLTEIQQAYWIGRREGMTLGGVGCHYYQEFEGSGLDPERLMAAFRRLIARHEMLRAVVLPDGTQRILGEVPPFPFSRTDLRGSEPAAAAAQMREMRARMAQRVFAPEQWPSFEIALTQLDGRISLEDLRALMEGAGLDESGSGLDQVNVH